MLHLTYVNIHFLHYYTLTVKIIYSILNILQLEYTIASHTFLNVDFKVVRLLSNAQPSRVARTLALSPRQERRSEERSFEHQLITIVYQVVHY